MLLDGMCVLKFSLIGDSQNSSHFSNLLLQLLPPKEGVQEFPDCSGREGEEEAGDGILGLGQEGGKEGGEEGEEGGRHTHFLLLLAQQGAGWGLQEQVLKVLLQGGRHHPA